MSEGEFTQDAILGGRISLRQPARGYRVNVDTILLAAAVEALPGMRLMEPCCGVGGALLGVASRAADARFLGVERDAGIADLARFNVAANDLDARVEIAVGDALSRDWGVFDGVFLNAPFDAPGEGRAPSPGRQGAYITDVPIERWIAALADRLRGGAALTLIHRAHKLPEIMAGLTNRLGGVEVAPVRARAAAVAHRVLVRARKGSRAPFRMLRGLDLHDNGPGKHTPEAEAILRGEALIDWRVN